jgi:putative tryptophan/tyrosine transport system substrate-binding protein
MRLTRRPHMLALAVAAGLAALLAIVSVIWTAPKSSPPLLKKVARVGYLTPSLCPDAVTNPTPVPFVEGLKDLGYREGKNIVIECRASDGTDAHYRRQATELVQLNVAVIFAVSSSAVRAARAATVHVPIVALDLESDPVTAGLAASLARPGANITGIFLDVPELSGKRLELLREAMPGLSRVAILWDVTMDRAPLAAMERTAQSLGIPTQIVGVQAASDFEAAMAGAVRQGAGALMLIQSPVMDIHRKEIAELALKHRLPAMGLFPSFVEEGGLLSYGPNVGELFRQAPAFIDKILRGRKPGDLPIERPTRFYMAVNVQSARALGLDLSPSFIARADQVVE